MRGVAYFIRRFSEECSIVKLHPDRREEILEHGLTLGDAERLYFVCIGEPVYDGSAPEVHDADYARHRRLWLACLQVLTLPRRVTGFFIRETAASGRTKRILLGGIVDGRQKGGMLHRNHVTRRASPLEFALVRRETTFAPAPTYGSQCAPGRAGQGRRRRREAVALRARRRRAKIRRMAWALLCCTWGSAPPNLFIGG
jgi:hypothetical protein